eukprot:1652203-Prymnesium_polylepis.1
MLTLPAPSNRAALTACCARRTVRKGARAVPLPLSLPSVATKKRTSQERLPPRQRLKRRDVCAAGSEIDCSHSALASARAMSAQMTPL